MSNPDTPNRTVVLVGHCMIDTMSLRSVIKKAVKQVKIVSSQSLTQLSDYHGQDTLLLINRQLNANLAGGSGVELIGQLGEQPDPPNMMLISNYADAQQEAIAAGALPGFGKNDMGDPQTRQRVADALTHDH